MNKGAVIVPLNCGAEKLANLNANTRILNSRGNESTIRWQSSPMNDITFPSAGVNFSQEKLKNAIDYTRAIRSIPLFKAGQCVNPHKVVPVNVASQSFVVPVREHEYENCIQTSLATHRAGVSRRPMRLNKMSLGTVDSGEGLI
jgi:hypothetical protein